MEQGEYNLTRCLPEGRMEAGTFYERRRVMKRPPITTMKALLKGLYVERFHTKKYKAILTRDYVGVGKPDSIKVVEYFDDGKGHSGAFTSEYSSVDESVFRDAERNGYITGLLKPGYVSKNEFKITEWGERRLRELEEEEKQAQKEKQEAS